MKPHLRIAEDRDAREPVSQKMIYCRADFFIIRSSRDACDASVCICPRVAYFSNAPGPICRVLPWCFHLQDQVQKMNEIRLRGCFANGGGQMLQFGGMSKIKLFPSPSYEVKQPKDSVVPRLPMTGILVGPSKSGKSTALVSMILEQYRGCFERVIIFSPSINVDDSWRPVKKYIEEV
ncbi:unnamed protein product, partial [Symbiodinium pilosum]